MIIVHEIRRSRILIFQMPAGKLVEHRVAPEIRSVALTDLDLDGVFELLVDQVDGWGTGVSIRTYRLISFASGRWSEIWSGAASSSDEVKSSTAGIALGFPDATSFIHLVVPSGATASPRQEHCWRVEKARVLPCEPLE